MTENKEIFEASYHSYISRYFLFMAEAEIRFAMPNIENKDLKNRYKLLLQKIRQIDNEFLRKGVNLKDVFKDFKEEKINAIHNTVAMMSNMEESECLEIENIVEEKMKSK